AGLVLSDRNVRLLGVPDARKLGRGDPVKVQLLTADDLIWKADGGSAGPAEVRLGELGLSARTFAVDPYPAYTHDLKLGEDLVGASCEAFPLTGSPADLYVCSHQFASRFNGLTYEGTPWRKPDGPNWDVDITQADGSLAE